MISRSRLRHAAIFAAALALFPVISPLACTVPDAAPLSQADGDRMTGFEMARLRGLGEAMLAESLDDRAIVSALFQPGDEPIDTLPDGRYRCRTIKLGKMLPLVTYGFFDCAISDNGTTIEKLTGSQRFKGHLAPSNGAMFYWGASHYSDEKPKAYGADPERDQVGCLFRIKGDPARYRLEMPFPQFESLHDIIELVAKR